MIIIVLILLIIFFNIFNNSSACKSSDEKKVEKPQNLQDRQNSENQTSNKVYNYGFNEAGLDANNRGVGYYKGQLRKIYNREKIWHSDCEYDVKVYESRRTLETILMLVLKHNYGPEFLNQTGERSLCSYIKTVYDNNLLGWDAQRLEEINSVKNYMNHIIHPYQGSYNYERNSQLKRSMYKLKEEFKKSIGLYAMDNSTELKVDVLQHKGVA